MLEWTITVISVFSPVLTLITGWQAKAWNHVPGRLIMLLAGAGLASDLIMLGLALGGQRNMPVAHLYGIAETALLLLYFCHRFEWQRKVFVAILFPFLCLYLLDSFYLTGIWEFNAYSRSLEALLMIVLVIIGFYKFYQAESEIFIDRNPNFWILVGILVYFSGAFFSFLLATDILGQSSNHLYGSWILHNISNILRYSILAVALWKMRAD